jgi:hypothetical protein
MRRKPLLLAFVLSLGFSALPAAESPVPQGFPAERYEALWKKSPFTLSSAGPEDGPAGFAQNLALTGVAQVGSDTLITLFNRQTQQRFLVSTKEPVDGINLVSVTTDRDLSKVSAVLKKGGETGTVKYDMATINMPSANAGGPPPNMPPPSPDNTRIQQPGQGGNMHPGLTRPSPRIIPRKAQIPGTPPPPKP